MILVAFGMLSKEFDAPMHLYDVQKGQLVELEEGAERSISECVKKHSVKMNLDRPIEIHGGKINYHFRKEFKDFPNKDFYDDVDKIWKVANRFGEKYAKKILVTMKDVGDVYIERASKRGIEVR